MRIPDLDEDYVARCYELSRQSIAAFAPQKQSSWYFQANSLLTAACQVYALGNPLAECRHWLQEATAAYRELFKLRGTSFTRRTRYRNGSPLPEEVIANDGYTSVDSFHAALAALASGSSDLARELVELAGHSPGASLVSPRSEVCTANDQTLSHALNALLQDDADRARHEAGKLAVRRASAVEQQVALMIIALTENGDVAGERDRLLFYHQKSATRRDQQLLPRGWLCLSALGLSAFAILRGQVSRAELATDSVYCPMELLSAPDQELQLPS